MNIKIKGLQKLTFINDLCKTICFWKLAASKCRTMRPEGRKAGASSRTPDAVFYKRHCNRWIGVSQEKFPGIWREALRQGRLDVRSAELVAFEQKGFSARFCQGVGETVAEIEASGMAAFPVVGVGLAGQEGLLFGNRF